MRGVGAVVAVVVVLLAGAETEAEAGAAAEVAVAAEVAAAVAAAAEVALVAEGVWDEEGLPCDWAEKAAEAWNCVRLRVEDAKLY